MRLSKVFLNGHGDSKYYGDGPLGTHACFVLGWVHESKVNVRVVTVRV